MDKLEELKKQLKALSQEEAEAIKEFLNSEVAEQTEATEEATVEVDTEPASEASEANTEAEPAVEESAAIETEEAPAEEAMAETVEEVAEAAQTEEELGEAQTEAAEEQPITEEAEPSTEAVAEEEQTPSEEPQQDDIPSMQKGEAAVDEEAEAIPNSLVAETGEELPVDYEQIIEAQNAKIAALQAENASLKTKVEGAFGYSAKPANSVKVNRLYDDAVDVHFRK